MEQVIGIPSGLEALGLGAAHALAILPEEGAGQTA
jgi:hypothetical protein